jgi:hypothetical protein
LVAPMGWGPLWVGGTHGLGAPMGWGPQRVSGRVYKTKPIIAVFCFLSFCFVLFKEAVFCSSSFFITLIEKKWTPLFGDPLPVADYQLDSGAPKAQRPPRLGGPMAQGPQS